jgi:predicted lipid-binding transport protein (Tim44 family)
VRGLFTVLLISGIALGQAADTPKPAVSSAQNPQASSTPAVATTPAPDAATTPAAAPAATPAPAAATATNVITIPAGTKIPLALAQAISTKNAREGDAVYATTVFPFVMENRVVVPAGAYIQGTISHVERAGHGHGRAEILMHFTSIIFPNGYTVMLPGSVENTPGADNKSVQDQEGTIKQDSETGTKVEDAAKNGAYGGAVGGIGGGLAGGLNGARIGAGAGAAAGIAWALLKRGSDVKLDAGTSIEMEIQRPIAVDAGRIAVAKAGS